MRKKILTAFMLFAVILTYAQKSVVTTGGEASGSGGNASYTIGQISYKNFQGDVLSDSQGVQHGYEIMEVSDQKTLPDSNSNLKFTVYPNPSADLVNVQVDNLVNEGLSYQLFTLAGRLLEAEKLTGTTTAVMMKNYAHGTYLIHIVCNDKTIRTFKILKN
jgi:type IX secretion system substrate protein